MNISNLSNSSQKQPATEESGAWLSPIIIVQIGLMFSIVGFNTLIIVLFGRMFMRKKVKKQVKFSDLMFVSLSVSDLFVGAFSLSMEMFFTIWPDYWVLGRVPCVIFVIIVYAQYTCSFMALLLLSSHRLMQLAFPLRTNERLTALKMTLIALTWLLPYTYYTALFVVLIALRRYNFTYCLPRLSHAIVLSTSISLNIVPIVLMILLNACAFAFILKIKRKRATLNSSRAYNMTKSKSRPTAAADAMSMQEMSQTNNNKRAEHTFNNSTLYDEDASQSVTANGRSVVVGGGGGGGGGGKQLRMRAFKRRISKDLRASVCICAIILNLITTQSIYIVTWPLNYYCRCVAELLFSLGYWLNYSFSAVNPLVLLIFHEGYRREFKKLFVKCNKTRIV
jgi:hypothetical protein